MGDSEFPGPWLTDTNTTPNVLKRQAWAYDAAGNRTVDQDDDVAFATSHDRLNWLQSPAPEELAELGDGGEISMDDVLAAQMAARGRGRRAWVISMARRLS